jgi:hypothetical protein
VHESFILEPFELNFDFLGKMITTFRAWVCRRKLRLAFPCVVPRAITGLSSAVRFEDADEGSAMIDDGKIRKEVGKKSTCAD